MFRFPIETGYSRSSGMGSGTAVFRERPCGTLPCTRSCYGQSANDSACDSMPVIDVTDATCVKCSNFSRYSSQPRAALYDSVEQLQ
jgi:hypothetical protein